jgi:hypothetical protein
MDVFSIVDRLGRNPGPVEYQKRELNRLYKRLDDRRLAGDYKDEEVDPETCIERIDWLLDGNYGWAERKYAFSKIMLSLMGKKGKNLERAWLAVGRDLTLLVALFETTEHTFRTITAKWKKEGVDFNAVNAAAAAQVRAWLEQQEGES